MQLVAVHEPDARRSSVAGEDPCDGRPGADLRPERFGRSADGLRHCAHPALREPPVDDRAFSADAADRVVEQHVGRSGLVRSRPLSDQSVDHHDRLHLLGLEPAVEQVGDAHREQPRDVRDTATAQATHLPCGLRLREQIAERQRTQVGWDAVQQWSDHVGHAVEPGLPGGKRVGVLRGELGHRRMRSLWVVAEDRDRATVGERLVVRTERRHAVSVIAEAEVVDDERGHQRHDVRVCRDADVGVIGERVARVHRPADLVACFEHDHARAGLREVRGGDEAVVPAANDDHVIRIRQRHVTMPIWRMIRPGRPG